jgi:putative intracellular protease/amidase
MHSSSLSIPSRQTTRIARRRPAIPGLVGRWLLRRLGLHPADREAATVAGCGLKAVCVATSWGVLDLGVPTGLFASELTVPYYTFLDAGLQVDLVSPRGGPVPVEPMSLRSAIRTAEDDRLLADPRLRDKLMESRAIAAADLAAYDIVYLAGGWGAAFDFGQSLELARQVSAAVTVGRVIGGICHGPLGLLNARRPDGGLLVEGRRLTAVTDRQIRQLGVEITPLHPESALRAAGARFEAVRHPLRDILANHWVADGDLITGQNQNAGPMVARLMLQRALAKRRGG